VVIGKGKGLKLPQVDLAGTVLAVSYPDEKKPGPEEEGEQKGK
jgi:hypothetical protein